MCRTLSRMVVRVSKSKTTGKNRETEISHHECRAFRALKCDGYTHGEIAFMFECTDSTVGKHVRHECTHETKRPKETAREGHCKYTTAEMAQAYREVYQRQPYERMSQSAYDTHRDDSHPAACSIQKRFGSWPKARKIVWGAQDE